MKISLIHAPNIQYDQNYGALFTPLWAYTLAAYIPSHWDIVIVDTVLHDPANIEQSDVFAFSGINQDAETIRRVYHILKLKFPDARYVVGGPITWSMEQEDKLSQLEYFDHIFILDGEQSLPAFLRDFERDGAVVAGKVIRSERFPMEKSRPINFDIYKKFAKHYYGAVIEVSRGCPFLCEFCDVRVIPGNNRANNKSPDLIVQEIDAHYQLGITQFQFACDNFIGDIVWARECVDTILAWRKKTGAKISIFTWLTINLHKMSTLMEQMREAGFSVVFIGIESVNQNSLLETAKVQNRRGLDQAVMSIQSYGFIIAPGFIFGFDSDTETVFNDTLNFLERNGVIGGDPSFLTALPGTPLFTRMKLTGRLVENVSGTVRRKIETNILYLQDSDFLKKGFIEFLNRYNSAEFQYTRFENHVHKILESGKYLPIDGIGYGSLWGYFRLQWGNPQNRKMMYRRALFLFGKPQNLFTVIKAYRLIKKVATQGYELGSHFNYWIYVWTNIGLKYSGIGVTDFQIHSIPKNFDFNSLLSDESSQTQSGRSRGDVDNSKAELQARYTDKALQNLVRDRISV